MIYVTREDLIEVIQEKLLDDSLQLNDDILNGLEDKAIAFVISYISGRYKTLEIFVDPVKRHPILTFTISRLVVYWSVRRNAARKVPEDYTDIYKEALAILKNIQNGTQGLEGLPEVGEEGSSSAKLMYGNNTNDNFFI